MSVLVMGTDVWPAIADVLARPGPRCVAVPYIGINGAELLIDLGLGDLLVCNASNSSLSQGATFPSSLLEIYSRGVQVRSLEKLHAKIYASGDRAFVGSANASASSIEKFEAGVVISAKAQVTALRTFIESLSVSADATRVDEKFLEIARRTFRAPRGGGGVAAKQARSWKLHIEAYGDSAPATVEEAAEGQHRNFKPNPNDLSATIDWSWGSAGTWKRGDVCLWVERSKDAPDTWFVDPPGVCVDAIPVGGRSHQVIYWWRTPGVAPIPWASLHRQVLLRTGRSIQMGQAATADKVTAAILDAYGLPTQKPTAR